MKKYVKLFVLFLFFGICQKSKAQETSAATYIDGEKPSLVAKKFAPGFISKSNEYEFGSIFSKDATEFYFAVSVKGKGEIRYTYLNKGKWTTPKTIISHAKYGYNDPFLSPDEQRLYYISNMPRDANDTINDIDIWYSIKKGNSWSEPINAGMNINSDKNEYYISFTTSGTMYFASNKNAPMNGNNDFDIYAASTAKGIFDIPKKLSSAINTKDYEADVFVAPDESYIIFAANRKEGFGRGDLYISFKSLNNEWLPAKNMGTSINTTGHELCPFVTYDGKYFFYTSKQDIYWVSTELFEQYR